MQSAYRQSIRVLSALMIGVGATLLAVTLTRGGGPLALGVVVGIALMALGIGRLVLARDRSRA